jgi:DNA-binding NarL/FixJ family response regulator
MMADSPDRLVTRLSVPAIDAPSHAAQPALTTAPPELQRRPRSRYDEVIVERCLAGSPCGVKPSTAEREQIVYTLRGKGLNDAQIARRTKIPERTVLRVRHRIGLPPVPRFVVGIKRSVGVAA